ncbi:hypothetical protein BELL_0304g00030 [Botrytis elliptica]|uniref:Uncharacterized protein n=1 Tax=Botrytis elliptica TaxID=278938 RepID=A0A4Z1JKL4_9HELO|nr:hypothetical protein BELL_0304g00030 [Botrytis elliptica]
MYFLTSRPILQYYNKELDVKLKKQWENSLYEWSLARDDQTVRAELGLGEPLDTILDHLLWSNSSNSSNSSKHLPESKQEGSMSPRSTKQKHREKKAHEQNSPVDKINLYVLFLPHPRNPKRPRSHPSQPPFIRISKTKLRSFSALFGDLLEQKQNDGLGDDDDNIVCDATTNHQPRKCIEDQLIREKSITRMRFIISVAVNEAEGEVKSAVERLEGGVDLVACVEALLGLLMTSARDL